MNSKLRIINSKLFRVLRAICGHIFLHIQFGDFPQQDGCVAAGGQFKFQLQKVAVVVRAGGNVAVFGLKS